MWDLQTDRNSGKVSERWRFISVIWRKLDVQYGGEEMSHMEECRLI